MKKSRFTETQIVSILKEVDAGMKVEEICRKHGISNATYYNWKSKYGGMEASDVKKLKELQDENAKLKQMFADLSLENAALKDLFEKKGWGQRRDASRQRLWSNLDYRSLTPVSWSVWGGRATTASPGTGV